MEESLFVFHLFQRYMFSAYILYTKISSDRQLKTRLRFMEDVIDSLVKKRKLLNDSTIDMCGSIGVGGDSGSGPP